MNRSPDIFIPQRQRLSARELQLARVFVETIDRRAPLLRTPSLPRYLGPSKQDLARQEIQEALRELKLDGTPDFSLFHTLDELADIFVFFISWIENEQLPVGDITVGLSRLNGAGGRSDALEVLDVLIQESADDARAAVAAIHQLLSIQLHATFSHSVLETIVTTIRKAKSNRDERAYSITEYGVELTQEEKIAKFTFVEQVFRMIRKTVKRTLRVSDWLPHRDILLDWRSGELALATLRNRLEAHPLAGTQTPGGVILPTKQQVTAILEQTM